MTKGQTRVDLVMAGDGQADLGIIGADPGGGFAIGHGFAEMLDQKAGGLSVKLLEPGNGAGGISEGSGFQFFGGQNTGFVGHRLYFAELIGHLRPSLWLWQVTS